MSKIIMSREWCMPNKFTFGMKPALKLINKYGKENNFKKWLDPFSGELSPAEFTNDLNPIRPAKFHMYAHEFVSIWKDESMNGCLFDPPYSLEQIKRSYDSIGANYPDDWTLQGNFFGVKDILSKKIKKGGISISFGWSSNGMGKIRGFEIIEILLLNHGGMGYDTICTVERKIK